MVTEETVIKRLYGRLPGNLRSLGKKLYYRNRHWAHPALKELGTVQDLYYWVANGDLDTLLLLQNYFSVFYPTLNTETEGTISLYDREGETLGVRSFSLGHLACAKFKVSSLLQEFQAQPGDPFGTLEVSIDIPKDVVDRIQEQEPFYFWDRFYIGYTNGRGQTCFVHGVDKTHIYRAGKPAPIDWYGSPKGHQWAPEIPVDIDDYEKFSVIMINRTSRKVGVTLTLSDSQDNSLSWDAKIAAKGVHRFELTAECTAGLLIKELRMRVKGMPTRYGRPMVFKEFSNGAMSAMHC
jgi:hypothetical protein